MHICTVPGCLSVMGHSFTVTTDTNVLIWHNESQVSFGDIHDYLCTIFIMFFKYILN